MNKKQEILDCIKTLNLTQEQANGLADVLASGGEGGSNKSVKLFTEWWDGNLLTVKINDKEILYTKGNEGDVGTVYLITEQDFNYIANAIKNCTEVYIEEIDETRYNNMTFGVNVVYASIDGYVAYAIKRIDNNTSLSLTNMFRLVNMGSKYYFIMG